MTKQVLRIADIELCELQHMLARFGLALSMLADGAAIPGSFWGDSEAGLKGSTVFARRDTPVHSVLHEACHVICMTPARRALLDGDAGGDYDEENAVCYLQILLADRLSCMTAERMCRDMDAWGYTFRLGSAQAWFDKDTEEEFAWLRDNGLLDNKGAVTWQCRSAVKNALSC